MNHSAPFTLTIPSKTFLLGEYLALEGGPALVANTTPRFALEVLPTTEGAQATTTGLASLGPAAKWLQANQAVFAKSQLSFNDPHQGQGGLGASTAEFVALAYAKQLLSAEPAPFDPFNLLPEYQQFAWCGKGPPPSGIDVIAQSVGGITFVDKNTQTAEALTWSLPDMDFCLLRTGHKIATHTHLEALGKFPTTTFRALVEQALAGLQQQDSQLLVTAIKDYAQVLAQCQFVLPQTATLLHALMQQPFVLAAKGCGAMGADVVLVITSTENRSDLAIWAKLQGLAVIANSDDITIGIKHENKTVVS